MEKTRHNNFIYEFGNNLYFNITNRCENNCDFCIRHIKDGVSGNRLWLSEEPTADDIITALDGYDVKKYDEAVFCGFGEPTCNLDVLLMTARELKRRGYRVRVNTNGLAELEYPGRDVAGELSGAVDLVSISLNEASAEKYDAVCHSRFGKEAYAGLLEFAGHCVEAGIDTTLSVVDCIGEDDVEKCRAIAATTGARFRVRKLIEKDTKY